MRDRGDGAISIVKFLLLAKVADFYEPHFASQQIRGLLMESGSSHVETSDYEYPRFPQQHFCGVRTLYRETVKYTAYLLRLNNSALLHNSLYWRCYCSLHFV